MYQAIVTGTVVCTEKYPNLEGIPLLVVQKIEKNKRTDMLVAGDATGQAGIGDHVYLVGSKEAANSFRKGLMPIDASIVGFIDQYNEVL